MPKSSARLTLLLKQARKLNHEIHKEVLRIQKSKPQKKRAHAKAA